MRRRLLAPPEQWKAGRVELWEVNGRHELHLVLDSASSNTTIREALPELLWRRDRIEEKHGGTDMDEAIRQLTDGKSERAAGRVAEWIEKTLNTLGVPRVPPLYELDDYKHPRLASRIRRGKR